ncbi:retrovirus-related pol polyprotein from transposon TNT 1-94, partial [Tanacetum coccineum]
VVLKGENFQEWERCMRNAFRAKQKLCFLDEIITKPDDKSLEIEDWWNVNSMLLAWFFNSIEPNLRSSISYFDTVKELWDDLRQRFSIGNGSRIQQILRDVSRMVKCNLAAELSKERDERQVHQFLMGLDDDLYGNICTNIIAQDPLPPLNRAYALVMTYLLAFNLKVTPTGGLGHMKKNSYGRGCSAASSSGRDRSSLTPALSDEQWNSVINMFKSLAPNNDNQAEKLSGMSLFLWILDIGASLHMTGDKSMLHDLHDIFPIPICLPIGPHFEDGDWCG